MRSWTIRKRLYALLAIGLTISVGLSGYSYQIIHEANHGFSELMTSNSAYEYSQTADMMHDALRGDVLGALLDGELASEEEVLEHAKIIKDNYASLVALPHSAEVKRSIESTLPLVDSYSKSAVELVKLAHTDAELARGKLPQFLELFGLLEEKLGVNGEAISKDLEHAATAEQNTLTKAQSFVVVFALAAIFVLVGLSLLISRGINQTLAGLVAQFSSIADQVTMGVAQINDSSRSLAESSSTQAASLEETAASLEEVSSMVRQTADNSQQAKGYSSEVERESDQGVVSMQQMAEAIDAIRLAAEETATIVKTIDEIAFQTNLLALNAAVEAARAGDAGKGFAVVAEEVRALAQRSSLAAKDTSDKIRKSRELADNGVRVSKDVRQSLESIRDKVTKTTSLVTEIAAASQEQAIGLREVNKAASQLDQSTQGNSAQAEELAAASHELVQQTNVMKEATGDLQGLILGTGSSKRATVKVAPIKPTSPKEAKKKAAPKRETKISELDTPLPPRHAVATKQSAPIKLSPEQVIPLDDGDFQGF